MSTINILSSKIFNRIAAGEVVERPFSVVKELVENSIDAKSKSITIEILGGGISMIKITDDGVGIEADELQKALLPHATSKISKIEDLDAITSLGFRGEALASIASVSKINVASKPVAQEEGAEISCEGGEMGSVIPCGMANGTVITVKNLFFNTPAREKFLKSSRTEEGEITSVVSRFILGNPDISFKYIVDGKPVYSSFGDGDESAFIRIYGAKTVNDCFRINAVKNGINISGYVGKHYFSKGNRTYQTVFINGRYVVNQTVMAAIQNAYSAYLMKRQYPFCVLSIRIPSEEVDVNVHPNKLDVRFANNQVVYGAIYSVISKVLDGSSEALNIVTEPKSILLDAEINKPKSADPEITKVKQEDKPYDFSFAKNPKFEKLVLKSSSIKFDENIEKESEKPVVDIFAENKAYLEKLEAEKVARENESEQQKKVIEKELNYIGQALNTFLIFDDGEDLYFIDQHAAHERLLFDKFNLKIENTPIDTQPLLVPFILNVTAMEREFLDEKTNVLCSMGFDICEFGGNAFKISSVPVFLSDMNIEKFFKDFLYDLDVLKKITVTSVLKEKIAQKACKSAIKAGDKLSDTDVKILLTMLKGDLGLKCPHGRPVAVKITGTEIEKWFKRIV